MRRRNKRLPGGPLGLASILAVGLLLLGGVSQIERWLRGPWSFGGLGQPTLTGTWEGPVRARLGADYRLLVDLSYAYRVSEFERDNLSGTARLCTRDGSIWEYTVRGFATRSGDSVELNLSSTVSDWRSHGFSTRGAWQGETLEVLLNNNPFKPDGRLGPDRTVSSADPDDSFQPGELRKGNREDFEAACRELAQR